MTEFFLGLSAWITAGPKIVDLLSQLENWIIEFRSRLYLEKLNKALQESEKDASLKKDTSGLENIMSNPDSIK